MLAVLLLVFSVVLIMISVWNGYRRGILLEGIRGIVLLLAAFPMVLFASGFTKKLIILIAKISGYDFADIEELSYYALHRLGLAEEASTLALPVGALGLSFFTPIGFSCLFLIGILITYLIYLLLRFYIKPKEQTPDAKSRFIGAAIGFVLGLWSGALLLLPMIGISGLIRENELSDEISSMFGQEKAQIANLYNDSPAVYLYRYTGTELLARKLYDGISVVTVRSESEDTTEKNEKREYSFPKLAVRVSEQLPNVLALKEAVKNLETIRVVDIDNINALVDDALQSGLLQEEESLQLTNSLLQRAGKGENDSLLSLLLRGRQYESMPVLEEDIHALASLAKLLIREDMLTTFTKDTRLEVLSESVVPELVGTICKLSQSGPMIAGMINTIVENNTQGAVICLVEEDALPDPKEKEDEIVQLIITLMELEGKMGNRDGLTIEELETLQQRMNDLRELSIIGEDNYNALLQYTLE